jgi:hypothetical protein
MSTLNLSQPQKFAVSACCCYTNACRRVWGSGGIARPFLTSSRVVGAALSLLDAMEKRILPLPGIELRRSSQYPSDMPIELSRCTYLRGAEVKFEFIQLLKLE